MTQPTKVSEQLVHLRHGGVSLLLDTSGLPRILHWGSDLGDDDDLAAVGFALTPQVVSSVLDDLVPVSVLPEQSLGWLGTPGLSGHRQGRDFSPLFTVTSVRQAGVALHVEARDDVAEMGLVVELELLPSGLLRIRATVTNLSATEPYTVDSLMPLLPVPTRAREILDFTGRHMRERSPQRHEFTLGTHVREGRRGRTGADATVLMLAGTPGFDWESGEVWGVHVAWSGNHRTLAERVNSGEGLMGGGELLLPGEGHLDPGESYTSPWLYGSHGNGLNELSARFHDYFRSRPQHPSSDRPVVMNSWEAVYFDHRLDRLKALVDAGAEVGVERFVLDDGWFLGRRDDSAGLGDWYVDPAVWPAGLAPLAEHVRSRGMQFGLWFEPEMVNPDSNLAREHPDWILSVGDRLPPEARFQQVLDLAEPDAYSYILDRISSLVSELGIDYIKWDHNRDLVEPGRTSTGRAGVHDQTTALYRLIDELKERHPGLEIESCSSGGARVDLGILERTDRIWVSDCIDALERQQIERWTGVLVPPEMMGSHVSSPRSHTTARTHDLSFRSATAFFGHFGIEWDLVSATAAERAELAEWIALHKRFRGLLHHGRVVRTDSPDPALDVHGVVAGDQSEALYAIVALGTSVWSPPGPVRLPGLDPQALYRLETLPAPELPRFGPKRSTVPWWDSPPQLSGRVLGVIGIQAPAQFPEHSVIIHAVRVPTTEGDRA